MERRNTLLKCHVLLVSFKKVHYEPMLKKYEYHKMVLCLLGNHECKNVVREDVLEYNADIMTERDYAEALNA